ncbi:hypothetical protein [Anaerococcus nagyae]|uniref:hypothetical protein n=1 Tax=Anaerococcus nagyae TaxID=1755241 RepID=UPI003736BD27
MIEVIIKNYLDETMDVPVYLEEPRDKPKSYVLFEKTSGGKDDQIRKATIALQSYAESMYEAASLNEKVKEAMDKSIYFIDIGKAKLNSDYNFTDTTTKRYRYQAVYDIAF